MSFYWYKGLVPPHLIYLRFQDTRGCFYFYFLSVTLTVLFLPRSASTRILLSVISWALLVLCASNLHSYYFGSCYGRYYTCLHRHHFAWLQFLSRMGSIIPFSLQFLFIFSEMVLLLSFHAEMIHWLLFILFAELIFARSTYFRQIQWVVSALSLLWFFCHHGPTPTNVVVYRVGQHGMLVSLVLL